MTWTRPVPTIGDPSSAFERGMQPRAWALTDTERAGLQAAVAGRRDIRRFRPDSIPDDVLRRILEAAHAAPSVGHSQPWRFIVVRDPETRERASLLADRERLAQAARLRPESARRLLDLQLEGIREAPLGVVVCCDRRVPAAGVLGRATFPDTDLWSCACAIENLWLAARAEGVGVGWVTLFQPADVADLLHLPEGVETLGWLCVGWPDERPPEPGLERAGWSRRLPLDDVLLYDRWPHSLDAPEPGRPPSHLRAPGPATVVAVRDASDVLLTPLGSLGVLDRALDRCAALGVTRPSGGTLVLVGADHPVTHFEISAYDGNVTREVLTAAAAGESMGAVAASAGGLRTVVVDAGVQGELVTGTVDARPHGPRGDLAAQDALTDDDVHRLVAAGREIGRVAAVGGVVALGEVGVGNTTVAAALTAALLGLTAVDVVGLGAGADTAMLVRKADVVTRALERVGATVASEPIRPLLALRGLGGAEFAVLVGVTLGAAGAGTVVILDGLATSVAALIAVRLEPGVAAHLVAGQRSREAAHQLVLTELGLEPMLDLRIRAGEGVGACLAWSLMKTGLITRRATGTTGPTIGIGLDG